MPSSHFLQRSPPTGATRHGGPGSSRVFIPVVRTLTGMEPWSALVWIGLGVAWGSQHPELPDKDHPDKAATVQVTGTSSQLSKSQEGHHSGLSPHCSLWDTSEAIMEEVHF